MVSLIKAAIATAVPIQCTPDSVQGLDRKPGTAIRQQ